MHLRGGDDGWNGSMSVEASIQRELSVLDDSGVGRNFLIFLCVFLGVIITLQGVLAALVFRHRHSNALQLHQPRVLLAYVLIAAFTTGSCLLFIPFNDISCILRDLFLVLPITIMGNLLVARSWRVNMLMNPALEIGGNEDTIHAKRRRMVKQQFVTFLTMIATCKRKVRDSSTIGSTMASQQSSTSRRSIRARRTSVRQKWTSKQLATLAAVLTAPQLIVQICQLAIPALQAEVINDGIYPSCYKSTHAVQWLGYVLAMIPIFMLIILSSYHGGLPMLEIYSKSHLTSIFLVCVTILISAPSLVFSHSTETWVYLASCIVVSFTAGTSWFVAAQNLLHSIQNEQKETLRTSLLLEKRTTLLTGNDREENEKSTAIALKIGKIFEEFGKIDDCIKLYNKSIEAYKFQQRRPEMVLVGGYSMAEINSFSGADLTSVIKLLGAKGKVGVTGQCTEGEGESNAYKDALDVYEKCPSSTELEDHSIIFPVFSGLFLQIKAGKINLDERVLAEKFEKVTQLHGDPVHYTRALAMKADVNARLGDFEMALQSIAVLETIYEPESHHEGICKSYGSDRSAQGLAAAIYWNRHLGNSKEVMRLRTKVVEDFLPKMDPKNVHNNVMLLLPVVKTMKYEGKYATARHLFDFHVCQNFERYFGDDGTTPCLSMFKPLIHLLDVYIHGADTPDLDEVTEWALDGDNGVSTDYLDWVITSTGWSPHCLMAELCLELSKVASHESFVEPLREKSLALARRTFEKITDSENGKVKLPIAFEECELLLKELDEEYDPMNYTRPRLNDPDHE